MVRRIALTVSVLLLAGCATSISIGRGGIGLKGGGVSVGASRGGVSIAGRHGSGAVGMKVGGDGRIGPTWPVPEPLVQDPSTPLPPVERPVQVPVGTTSAGLLIMPIAQGRLTSGFGPRRGRHHNGVDYAAPHGTLVHAAGDGVIEELRHSSSYGNYLRIRHGVELSTAYAHLSGFAPTMRKGAVVRRGQIIGAVGSTGRTSGPHLHYEVIERGVFVDPLLLGR